MELRHLRYFVAVAEEENVTRAAARLRVAQPSLSRQIRDLEEDLEVMLFARGPRSLRLTEAGRVFLSETRSVLRRLDEAVEAARVTAHGNGGEIHVGFAPSLTVELLPGALRRLHESHPRVRVQLHDLSTREMVEGLAAGELDAALMIRPPKLEDGVVFEELRRLAVCVAVAPGHPLARAGNVALTDVARDRLISYDSALYPEYREWLGRVFSHAEVAFRIAEEHEGSSGLIAAVEAGRGVALVQEGFEGFSGVRLVLRRLDPELEAFVVGVAGRADTASPRARAFIEAARESAAER